MLKSISVLIVLFLGLTHSSLCQDAPRPTLERLVLLIPDAIEFPTTMDSTIDATDSNLMSRLSLQLASVELNDPKNTNYLNILSNGDSRCELMLKINDMLVYHGIEQNMRWPVLVDVTPSTASIPVMKQVCRDRAARFLVSIPSIAVIHGKSDTMMLSRLVIYDSVSNSIIADNAINADIRNQGFTYSCDDGKFECLMLNTMSQVTQVIMSSVFERDETVKGLRNAKKKKYELISAKIETASRSVYSQQMKVLSSKGFTELNTPFYCMISPDSSKFIAFFQDTSSVKDERDSRGPDSKTVHIEIQSMDDIGALGDKQPFFFSIAAVLYNGEWCVENLSRTFPQVQHESEMRTSYVLGIIDKSYFQEGTSYINLAFWESYPFDRVEDITKKSEWKKYRSAYESEERRNRPYIGWYRVVAEQEIKRRKIKFDKRCQQLTIANYQPYLKLLKGDWQPLTRFVDDTSLTFITPPDSSIWITPIVGVRSNGDTTLRFIAWEPSSSTMYRWTKFDDVKAEKGIYTVQVVDLMETVSFWNYAVDDYYTDSAFWSDHVFKKENGGYLFLRKMP